MKRLKDNGIDQKQNPEIHKNRFLLNRIEFIIYYLKIKMNFRICLRTLLQIICIKVCTY